MGKEILLSIAIPTYNRYQYLEDCLKATGTIKSERMEIIVQDNSENNNRGQEIIQSINDNRVKYFYTKERITVSENCSAAIEHSRGKYVCLLGDDDTVCDNIIDLVEEMQKINIETCVFGINTYHWPDLIEQMSSLNSFESVECIGEIIKKNPNEILYKQLREAFQTITEMPRVYHAIASKEILNKIKDITGTYFPGPSPDMANAVGCALLSAKHIQTDIPVMISGYGGTSGGGMGRKHQHRGSLTDKPWLPKNILDIWDRKIPQLWMGDTIWPVSAVTALKALNREELINKLNYGVIYGEILIHERLLKTATMGCKLRVRDWYNMVTHVLDRILKKIFRIGKIKTIVVRKQPISLIEAKLIQDEVNLKYSFSKAFSRMRDV